MMVVVCDGCGQRRKTRVENVTLTVEIIVGGPASWDGPRVLHACDAACALAALKQLLGAVE